MWVYVCEYKCTVQTKPKSCHNCLVKNNHNSLWPRFPPNERNTLIILYRTIHQIRSKSNRRKIIRSKNIFIFFSEITIENVHLLNRGVDIICLKPLECDFIFLFLQKLKKKVVVILVHLYTELEKEMDFLIVMF